MATGTVNRNFKDGIFRKLFNDEEALLELYNAISGKEYPKGTPVKIVTLENVIFNELKDDLAFIVDDRFIILAEQQSTLSPNFPLRLFCYLAKEYEKLAYSSVVFSKRQVKLPTPELYVFYNGEEDAPVESIMKLSDAFTENCDILAVEIIVKVINVNYDKGAEILQRCRVLKEYSLFIHNVRMLHKETCDLNFAVNETIRNFIETDRLKDFLLEHRGEIMSVLEVMLTQEERDKIREDDGYQKGFEIGETQKARKVAKAMKAAGEPLEKIMEFTELTEADIENL